MNECDHNPPSSDAQKPTGHPKGLQHAPKAQQWRPKQTNLQQILKIQELRNSNRDRMLRRSLSNKRKMQNKNSRRIPDEEAGIWRPTGRELSQSENTNVRTDLKKFKFISFNVRGLNSESK
jgi:hypothetical protein